MSKLRDQDGYNYHRKLAQIDSLKYELMAISGNNDFSLFRLKDELNSSDPSKKLLKKSCLSNIEDKEFDGIEKSAMVYGWVTNELEFNTTKSSINQGKSGQTKLGLKSGHDIRMRELQNYRDEVISKHNLSVQKFRYRYFLYYRII
jgi:hypothetical protein